MVKFFLISFVKETIFETKKNQKEKKLNAMQKEKNRASHEKMPTNKSKKIKEHLTIGTLLNNVTVHRPFDNYLKTGKNIKSPTTMLPHWVKRI